LDPPESTVRPRISMKKGKKIKSKTTTIHCDTLSNNSKTKTAEDTVLNSNVNELKKYSINLNEFIIHAFDTKNDGKEKCVLKDIEDVKKFMKEAGENSRILLYLE